MGETAIQTAMRNREQVKRKIGGQAGPYVGKINSVNPYTERANVDFYSGAKGGQGLPVLHPFLSMGSWIRCMPDEGTGVLLHNRVDTLDPEIERYYQPATSNRVQAYATAVEAYRPLQPGEMELSSKGLAQAFLGRRSVLDLRGGVIREWHDQDKLEHGNRAPTHRNVGYQNTSDQIGDEERFGVVKRPTSSVNEEYIKDGDDYTKEHLEVLLYEGTPNILYDKRKGHVIDNDGNKVTSNYTGNALRKKDTYYTINKEAFIEEIDELGNVTLTLPTTDAEEGFTLIVPAGNFKLQVGKDISTVASGNRAITIAENDTLVVDKNQSVEIKGDVSHSYAENLTFKTTKDAVTVTDRNGNKITLSNSELAIEGSKKVHIKGSSGITIEDSNVVITGGNLTVNNKVPVAPTGNGPFCALPVCLLTGAPHIGNVASQT